MPAQIDAEFIGIRNYEQVASWQKQLVPDIKGTDRVFVLGAEFEPVITLGLRAQQGCDVIAPSIPAVKTDRGGFATIHSPGQLVVYPMIDLRYFDLGIKNYIDILFKTTGELLTELGVESEYDSEKPGLYTARGKISFVGIKVDQGVVRHGLSLNVKNDLTLFQMIKSCGIRCQNHDKIENYVMEKDLPMKDLFHRWVDRFKINLDFKSPNE